jgi:hypothetical protein
VTGALRDVITDCETVGIRAEARYREEDRELESSGDGSGHSSIM